MTVEDLITAVRAQLLDFGELPEGLSHVDRRIPGTAFFPGGDGVIKPRDIAALPDIMVVGRDFGTLEYLQDCLRMGEERPSQPTWRPLLSRIRAADIDPHRCYFTNAFVGFRRAGGNTDFCCDHDSDEFRERCRALLQFQVLQLRPRAIVALGKDVPSFLGTLSPDLGRWANCKRFPDMDAAGPLIRGASFGAYRSNVCVLVHPSKSWLNERARWYVDSSGYRHTGAAAEIAILRDAIA